MGILVGAIVVLLAMLFLDDMELTAVSLIIAIPLGVTYQLTESIILSAVTTFGIVLLLGLLYRYEIQGMNAEKQES